MTNNLIGTLNTLGNSMFIINVFMNGSLIDSSLAVTYGNKIKERMVQRFFEYDQIVQNSENDGSDGMPGAMLYFQNILKLISEQERIKIQTNTFTDIMKLSMTELSKEVATIAKEATITYVKNKKI